MRQTVLEMEDEVPKMFCVQKNVVQTTMKEPLRS